MNRHPERKSARWYDFHVHTACSDGVHTPQEVRRMAGEAGIDGISITDHDTIDAYRDLEMGAGEAGARRELSRGSPWILPGVEISSRLRDSEAHILGYFPRGITRRLSEYVEGVLARRASRLRRAVVRLRQKGIEISWAECANAARGRVVSLNHIAQILAAKRYVGRSHRAYDGLLSRSVVPLPEDRAEDVVAALADLGGLVVWAHPGRRQFAEGLDLLVGAGLDGVEVFIPRRNTREEREMARVVGGYGLFVTGGSDSHGNVGDAGDPRSSRLDGRRRRGALGRFRVSESAVREFLSRVGRSE